MRALPVVLALLLLPLAAATPVARDSGESTKICVFANLGVQLSCGWGGILRGEGAGNATVRASWDTSDIKMKIDILALDCDEEDACRAITIGGRSEPMTTPAEFTVRLPEDNDGASWSVATSCPLGCVQMRRVEIAWEVVLH